MALAIEIPDESAGKTARADTLPDLLNIPTGACDTGGEIALTANEAYAARGAIIATPPIPTGSPDCSIVGSMTGFDVQAAHKGEFGIHGHIIKAESRNVYFFLVHLDRSDLPRTFDLTAFASPAANAGTLTLTCAAAQSGDFSAIEQALAGLKGADGPNRVDAQMALARAITRAGGTTAIVRGTIRQLLSEHRSGQLDDAIDVISLLGRGTIHALSLTGPPHGTLEAWEENYWYAVVRAAGKVGDRETVLRFVHSGLIALEEAAVQALSDLEDPAAVEDLRRISTDASQAKFIRDLAAELADELA